MVEFDRRQTAPLTEAEQYMNDRCEFIQGDSGTSYELAIVDNKNWSAVVKGDCVPVER